jgi:hypothetical protein
MPAFRSRKPVVAWSADDRLGTFVAAVPGEAVPVDSFWQLHMLHSEDESVVDARAAKVRTPLFRV